MSKNIKYSVIVPCFNEEEVILVSHSKIVETMNKLEEPYEIIFINDGSRDNTLSILKDIALNDKNVKVISFSRNFGQQKATTAGIENCSGQVALIIDADLQDPPYVMLEMIEKWKQGYDMVYGQRKSREGETFLKKLTSKAFYRCFNALSEMKFPVDASDFRLIDRKIIDNFKALKEQKKYIRGYFTWVGYKSTNILFDREARQAGETKYNYKSLLKLAIDGIVNFSNKPLKFPLIIGIIASIYGIISLITNICLKDMNGVRFAITILFFGTLFFSQAITNRYIEMINDNSKERPNYIIDEKIGFNEKEE